MSKRVLILLGIGLLSIVISFMLLKYEMSKPIEEEEEEEEEKLTTDSDVQKETATTDENGTAKE